MTGPDDGIKSKAPDNVGSLSVMRFLRTLAPTMLPKRRQSISASTIVPHMRFRSMFGILSSERWLSKMWRAPFITSSRAGKRLPDSERICLNKSSQFNFRSSQSLILILLNSIGRVARRSRKPRTICLPSNTISGKILVGHWASAIPKCFNLLKNIVIWQAVKFVIRIEKYGALYIMSKSCFRKIRTADYGFP